MKKELKKIVTMTAALVLTCGCIVSGLRRTPELSFAEGSNTEQTEKVTGDINGDGAVNAADILKMLQYLYGVSELDENETLRADGNSDSKIDVADFILLKNKITDPDALSPDDPFYGALAAPDLKNIRRESGVDAMDYMNFSAASAEAVLVDSEDENGAENPVYSPLSYYMALSMTAECAAGNTRDEIVKALGSEDIEKLRESNEALFRCVNFEYDAANCILSNSLWLNNKYDFKQDTLNLLAKDYYAVSFAKDFGNKQTANEISDWISKNTKGKLNPEIKIDDPELDVMKILNTVTFKAPWDEAFKSSGKEVFHKRDGSEVACDFLKEQTNGAVGSGDNYKVFCKSYDYGFRMNFVLPDEGVDINDIISDSDTLAAIYTGDYEAEEYEVDFSMPQFEVSSKFDLKGSAQKLGISDAFNSGKADFSSLTDNEKSGAYIDAITQEAVLKTDKDGSEGAAYTIVEIKASASPMPLPNKTEFKLDRPFFYYVSYGRIPVFAGVIDEPDKAVK